MFGPIILTCGFRESATVQGSSAASKHTSLMHALLRDHFEPSNDACHRTPARFETSRDYVLGLSNSY